MFSSNSVEDCQWLRSTALKHLTVPVFREFVLFGNEDCPQRVELYDGVRLVPLAAYDCDEDGNLRLSSRDWEAY